MFNREYRFAGSHALKVNQLTNVFDSESRAKLFDRNIDVYVNAPLVGFLYGRKATKDTLKNPETNQVYTQHIMGDRVIYSQDDLIFNYRLIILLDKNYEPDLEKRIDKAFRYMGNDEEDRNLFESYVLGGVDVLYDKLIEGATGPSDYIENLFNFVEEFNDRFNNQITEEEILALCI